MINVVGSSPAPLSSLPPELPGDLPVDPTTSTGMDTTTATATPTDSAVGSTASPPQNKKSKISTKYLLAGVLLLLLVVGSGVGLYLMNLKQDLRQQASVYEVPIIVPSDTTPPPAPPTVVPPEDTTAPSTTTVGSTDTAGCSGSSAAQCQGKDPGDRCGNNAPFGVCRALPNQANSRGIPCTCDTPDEGDSSTTSRTSTGTTSTGGTGSTDDGGDTGDTGGGTGGDEEENTTGTGGGTTDNINTNTNSNTVIVNDDDYSDTLADSGTGGAGTTSTGGTTKGGQPVLPSELPQTGPEDWLRYLQIGLGILGAGALLLLFL